MLDSERSNGFKIKCLLNEQAKDAKQLFLHMFRENHDRENLSPWEQGEMFKKALDSQQFSDSMSLAEACGISPSTVSQYVSLAELPAEVVLAFRRPQSIAMRWAQSLNRALKTSSSAVLECARHIATLDPPLQPQDVLKKLVEAAESDSQPPPREDVVKLDNKVLFRYKSRRGGPVIHYGKLVRPEVRKLLDDKIKALLESEIRGTWDR
jgi:ParB family chromosome partitioning protein